MDRDRNILARPCTVAVAVPTYLREDVLVRTLEQVLAQDPPADEVLVIDQTERHTPDVEGFLRENDVAGALRWVRHSPANLPGARNRALRESTCDVVVFIDDDVELPTDFVARHARNYADPAVHAVAGRVRQEKWGKRPAQPKGWPRELDYRYFRLDGAERVVGVANFMGANHSVRRATVLDLGGYDENYVFNGYREDTDAALRLARAGRTIVFDPDAVLTHLQLPSGGCQTRSTHVRRPAWARYFGEQYFLLRHFFPGGRFWQTLLVWNVRRHVLQKANVLRPWRLPGALVWYFYALGRAVKVARQGRAASAILLPLPPGEGRGEGPRSPIPDLRLQS
jgi:GT2 family glycosyltransferase